MLPTFIANTQSVGQDDRTPEGLVLRELVEYCINIKELLDDKILQTANLFTVTSISRIYCRPRNF